MNVADTPSAGRQRRLPPWLKRPLPRSRGQKPLDDLLDHQRLHTVCEEANCPNKAQCFTHGTATFMILGDTCTRRCQFCSVKSGRPPNPPDPDEPRRLAETAAAMKLSHVVVTSVDRDDLADGGSAHWAAVVVALKAALPDATIEVLTPDFQGRHEQIERVVDSGPRIFNHNIETVPSLYRSIQPGSVYRRSLAVLARVKQVAPTMTTKSGLMVGLGETREEVSSVLRDLRAAGVDMLTVGQYLKPEPGLAEVKRYYEPREFDEIRDEALAMGFPKVASGPFVRSSYNAKEQFLLG
ncbi:MAG: lipoyl synthase [Planctomycetes bacterium]|nr:lipoyl synthase [Planctomycetota bacterium]MCB9934819.1 lipoyl synthase [Planctomycetota bacterium]